MLQHVWERASQARYLTDVVVATDDDRILQAAEEFGAKVVLTRDDHASGTDRVAEAASASTATVIVNIQGDEPMIDPFAIDAAVLGMLHDENVPMGTLKKRIDQPREIDDPNVVKVVTDHLGNAIYFSRAPIPYHRDGNPETTAYYKHIGSVRLPPRFPARLSGSSRGTSRTGRAAGAIARARKRISNSRGGNGI